MATNIVKYRNIYAFITILSIIGFICGFFFYKTQPQEEKEYIESSINIKEELSSSTNSVLKKTKNIIIILLSSILIVTQIYNIFKIFYEPFQLGFIFAFLKTYNFKLASIYIIVYYLIPLIITIILIRVSITISTRLIRCLIYKSKKDYIGLKRIIQKYLIISLFLITYEIIISIFSTNLNAYLITFL